jgi:hypothetical protein
MKRRALIPIMLAAAATLTLGGCGGAEGPARTSFGVEVAGAGGSSLQNDFGYRVELTEARLHLGPIHFFSGDPLFSGRAPDEGWPARLARRLLGVRLALAHPGHYQQGEALGEVLSRGTVDLLAAAPTRLGTAEGITGRYGSARVAYAPAADNAGHAAHLRGVAKKGGESIAFMGDLDASEEVAGIACAAEVGTTGGTMQVGVKLEQWIARIDFSLLDASAGEVQLAPGSQGHNALTRGIHNTSAFSFTFTKER